MISNKSLFYSFEKATKTIHWGNAKSAEIKGIGNCYIEFIDLNICILLRNCYYMPELGINLIANLALNNNIYTIFTKYHVFLQRGIKTIT